MECGPHNFLKLNSYELKKHNEKPPPEAEVQVNKLKEFFKVQLSHGIDKDKVGLETHCQDYNSFHAYPLTQLYDAIAL